MQPTSTGAARSQLALICNAVARWLKLRQSQLAQTCHQPDEMDVKKNDCSSFRVVGLNLYMWRMCGFANLSANLVSIILFCRNMQAHTHARMHARILACMYARMPLHACVLLHARMLAGILARLHASLNACKPVCVA